MKKKGKEEDEKAMGRSDYGSRFRQEAKAIFLQQRTFSNTIKELKRRGYKRTPHPNTMAKWGAEEQWEMELSRRDELMEHEHDPKSSGLNALLMEVTTMRKICRQKIMDKAGGVIEIKASNSQDFYAYNQLVKTEAQIIENIRRAEAAEAEAIPVKVIFGAMLKHPKIGPLFDNAKILAEMEQLIGEEMLEYQKKAVGL